MLSKHIANTPLSINVDFEKAAFNAIIIVFPLTII